MKSSLQSIQSWKPQFVALWPALNGSLNKVYKPCIRKNCLACARGQKHPAWLLTFTQRGRRYCFYVPLNLLPTLRRAFQNGRKLEQLLYRVGPALVRQHRQDRKKLAVKPPQASKS